MNEYFYRVFDAETFVAPHEVLTLPHTKHASHGIKVTNKLPGGFPGGFSIVHEVTETTEAEAVRSRLTVSGGRGPFSFRTAVLCRARIPG